MKLMNSIITVVLFYHIVLFQSCKTQENNTYIVNKIDSTSLSYYYLINISPADSLKISYNLLSNKGNGLLSEKKNIKVGGKYKFYLLPMYDMIEKRGNKDSVIFSPALMRSIVINGNLLFIEDYSLTPFSTNNLKGLQYIKH